MPTRKSLPIRLKASIDILVLPEVDCVLIEEDIVNYLIDTLKSMNGSKEVIVLQWKDKRK